jgi:hypothetical protein
VANPDMGYEDVIIALPHLEGFPAACGMCEYQSLNLKNEEDSYCKGCVLNPKDLKHGCICCDRLYLRWYQYSTKPNAQAVLTFIKEKYQAHLKRYYSSSCNKPT